MKTAKEIAGEHYLSDSLATAVGERLTVDVPVAMITGVWPEGPEEAAADEAAVVEHYRYLKDLYGGFPPLFARSFEQKRQRELQRAAGLIG